ncbi:variant surface glycoprotein (VSG), putative [Trypanosoma brucei brucei TREU927]|uniref:Variant surface glycoprotein (VSG), putative n=1 Tax=Trypanosoma brucei brucei (strain 927/4 GUTat10.1) TaxID=185431 RepID=Q4FKE6_TRYB2|nr:variant surface glycoprotein [Trypanosoma brucei brucei TREU927]EAN80679.1 variant surface glycoprotein (VSG), putative [Trypanosoma brucei brucei TREU927]CAJ17051.1 variant surface glycoprotein (VSG), putative [Trypanosoma brucei brucei TREU927]
MRSYTRYFLTFLYVIKLLMPGAEAATSAGKSAAEYRTLCKLIRLAQSDPEPLKSDDSVASDAFEIDKLNMTAASAEWRTKFGGGGASHDWQASKGNFTNQEFESYWGQKWPNWLKTEKATYPNAANKKWLEQNPPPKQGPAQAKTAKQLAVYAEEAAALARTYTEGITAANGRELKAIKTALRAALYGDKQKDGEGLPALKPPNEAECGQDDCKGTNVGDNLAYDVLCLCAGKTAAESKGCTHTQLTTGWTSGATNVEQTAKKLLDNCAEVSQPEATAANIASAIANLEQMIGRYHGDTAKNQILGKSTANHCSGDDDHICVDYESYYNMDLTPKTTRIKWMQQLEIAARLLNERKEKKEKLRTAAAALKTLRTAAEATYAARQIHQLANQPSHSQAKDKAKSEVECNTNTTNQTCTKANCKWEEKGGKGECKSKPGTETPEAATGEKKDGDNKASAADCKASSETNCDTTKCTWNKEKNECKVKEGTVFISAVIKVPLLLAFLLF